MGFEDKHATTNAGALVKYFHLNTDEYMKEFRLYASSKPIKKYSQATVDFLKRKLEE